MKSKYKALSGNKSTAWKGYEEMPSRYFSRLISRHKKHKYVEFNITLKYLWELFTIQERRCALSNIELSLDSINFTASLDRIDSTKGYIIGNVQWLHKDINFMKNNLPLNVFLEWMKLITLNNSR